MFVDFIIASLFDGQTLRIEFGVSRVEEMKSDAPVSLRRYPARRLVLSPMAEIDLVNRMQQIASTLAQAGIVKPAQSPTTSTAPRKSETN